MNYLTWQGELIKRVALYHNSPDMLETWIVSNVPQDYWRAIAVDLPDPVCTNMFMRTAECGL